MRMSQDGHQPRENATTDFDPDRYQNRYRQACANDRSQIAGQEVGSPRGTRHNVVDLMEALNERKDDGKTAQENVLPRPGWEREPGLSLTPIPPMEPVKCEKAFDSEDHIFQVKWDGVRVLAFFNGAEVTLQNRRLHDRTLQYPELQSLTVGKTPDNHDVKSSP